MTKDVMKDAMKKEIDRLLRTTAPSGILALGSDTVERAYEAYIWSLCKRAVEEAGGSAVLKGIVSGGNPPNIVLRGSPGSMASRAKDFCYIECRLQGKEFEIHLDVQYEGSSGASHEVDISIYDHASADAVRASGWLPKSRKLIMVIECKFYTVSVPSAGLGRAFVGLVSDCNGTRLNAFVSNKASKNLDKYFTNKANIEPFTDLDPAKDAAAERFVRIIEQALRKWAK